MTRTGRSVATRLVLPVVVLQAGSWFAMLAHGASWRGDWMNAVDQAAGTVVITGPLLAALVANEYARRDETSLPALAVSSTHPLRAWYRPVTVLVLLAWANLVVVVGQAAVLTKLVGVPVFVRPLPVLGLSALVLACHALLGMALGLRLAPRLAGPVAGTASFAVFLLAVAHLAPACFNLAAASGELVGERYRSSTLLVLGSTALISAVALAATTRWRGRSQRWSGGLALVGVVAAMVLSHGGLVDLDSRYVAVPTPLSCRGDQPKVCVAAEAPRALSAAARRMHRLARPLVAAQVRLPDQWTYYWGQREFPVGGVLRMQSSRVLDTRVQDSDVVSSLAMPALCAGFFADPSRELERALEVRSLLEQWIGVRNDLGHGFTDAPHAWFVSPESATWVRTTYAQLRRCDLAAVRMPTW